MNNYIKNNIQSTSISDVMHIIGSIQCENPNKDLHSFKGILNIKNQDFTLSDK